MHKELFWKGFWIVFCVALLVSVVSGVAVFLLMIHRENDLVAVAVTYSATKDPFETPLESGKTFSLGGILYHDALPLGFTNWEWQASDDWRSTDQHYQGSYALKASFQKPMGSVGMNGAVFSTSGYNSLSIALYPDSAVGDLYFELYDEKGNALPIQSLAWYAGGSSLQANQWQVLSIPLQNLMGTSTGRITGFAVSAKNPGVAYLDAIELQKVSVSHAVWTPPPDLLSIPYDPLATSTATQLPYTFAFTPQDLSHWYTYYGTLSLSSGVLIAGPAPGGNSDAISIYRGGKNWGDYVADATLDWGETTAFSILVRFTSDSDYANCAFSHYGDTVQIYEVKAGRSTLMAQTPTLAIRYDAPWAGVPVEAQIQGQNLDCSVNGVKVLSAHLHDLSRQGTVGIESWDQNSHASAHQIHTFTVIPTLSD